MPKYRVELLDAAWLDVDKIADFHLEKVGAESAQRITDKILDHLLLLGRDQVDSSYHFAPGIPKPVKREGGNPVPGPRPFFMLSRTPYRD